MPYLEIGQRKMLMTEPERAKTDGDYNYLFTTAYLKTFTETPRYATIALIRKASINPDLLESVKTVEALLMRKNVPALDRVVARDLAFVEFYRRVGSFYEQGAILRNGDLPEYETALCAVVECLEVTK